ncbi:hypothetical protein AT5G06043 [Arabidopsis thaliana]|uniref:Uncharacterized protein n=2 Tax=Arabidopsis TaxID=3701 RepID=Q2V397_ARATH|nr:uncharacterized protein AT5G06043 [Arabidopsis thaliana]ABF59404.1 unknown protein [Arabidopsis thaliana]AED90958.1 hypothetical protein AT5G06043 [Arabidopsis thaliana]|eukprot:NP_001031841.1 hypothetical protein AT5G06043 [Arabidopsis thaliana]
MRGAVLAFPDQDRSHTCSVRDWPRRVMTSPSRGRRSSAPSKTDHPRRNPLTSFQYFDDPPAPEIVISSGWPVPSTFLSKLFLKCEINLSIGGSIFHISLSGGEFNFTGSMSEISSLFQEYSS